MTTLTLFDIDATLLLTGGAGMNAMERAGRRLFGEHFSTAGIDFAGRIDPLLIREMLQRHAVEPTADRMVEFRRTYTAMLESDMASSTRHHALPGAIALVRRLQETRSTALGVLTGNFAETGSIKLRRCGFHPEWFAVRVWGDDSPHDPPSRDHLPGVAIERFAAVYGARLEPARVTIIGDTPHDVRCARVHGCRSLGVATGRYTADELERAGADRVVADLGETDDLAAWLIRS